MLLLDAIAAAVTEGMFAKRRAAALAEQALGVHSTSLRKESGDTDLSSGGQLVPTFALSLLPSLGLGLPARTSIRQIVMAETTKRLEDLPNEILTYAFSFLQDRPDPDWLGIRPASSGFISAFIYEAERRQSLAKLCRVNRRFHALSQPLLYQYLVQFGRPPPFSTSMKTWKAAWYRLSVRSMQCLLILEVLPISRPPSRPSGLQPTSIA